MKGWEVGVGIRALVSRQAGNKEGGGAHWEHAKVWGPRRGGAKVWGLPFGGLLPAGCCEESCDFRTSYRLSPGHNTASPAKGGSEQCSGHQDLRTLGGVAQFLYRPNR